MDTSAVQPSSGETSPAALREKVRGLLGAILGHSEILLEAPPAPLTVDMRADVDAIHALASDMQACAERLLGGRAAAQAATDPSFAPVQALRRALRIAVRSVVGHSEMLLESIEQHGLERLMLDVRQIERAARSLLGFLDEQAGRLLVAGRGGAQEPRSDSPSQGAAPSSVAAAGTVLVVDDSRTNRLVLTANLQAEGYQVVAASEGPEALEKAREGGIDLVLLDVVMKGMSGLEVLRLLRLRHSVAELPVIMVTSMNESEDTVTALDQGANDYVTKPIDFRVLVARMRTQLALRRATEEARHLAAALKDRNDFIRATLDRYLSTQVVESLLETPDGLRLGGERRSATILMCDLRGFTALTQAVPPEKVVRILNRYLGTMADIIREFDGTVDEFIGDAILALFGAPVQSPRDAERAVACAVKMQRAIEAINRSNRQDELPEIQMGVAINTGEVIVGNMGSARRAKYGAVGNPVNVAARVESYTVGGQVLITRNTLEAAGPLIEADGPHLLQAQGLREPIEYYDVRGVGGEYDLRLPRRESPLRPLAVPIPIRCARMREKRQDGEEVEARLVALSSEGAEVSGGDSVAPLQTLRLRFRGEDGNDIDGDVYCKVLQVHEQGRGCVVRFTAFDPQAERFVRSALAAMTGERRAGEEGSERPGKEPVWNSP